MNLVLPDKVYDILKWIAMVVLPAIGTLYLRWRASGVFRLAKRLSGPLRRLTPSWVRCLVSLPLNTTKRKFILPKRRVELSRNEEASFQQALFVFLLYFAKFACCFMKRYSSDGRALDCISKGRWFKSNYLFSFFAIFSSPFMKGWCSK